MSNYYVYLLECSDKTFYTGWTNNIEKRTQEHNKDGIGIKSFFLTIEDERHLPF